MVQVWTKQEAGEVKRFDKTIPEGMCFHVGVSLQKVLIVIYMIIVKSQVLTALVVGQ